MEWTLPITVPYLRTWPSCLLHPLTLNHMTKTVMIQCFTLLLSRRNSHNRILPALPQPLLSWKDPSLGVLPCHREKWTQERSVVHLHLETRQCLLFPRRTSLSHQSVNLLSLWGESSDEEDWQDSQAWNLTSKSPEVIVISSDDDDITIIELPPELHIVEEHEGCQHPSLKYNVESMYFECPKCGFQCWI